MPKLGYCQCGCGAKTKVAQRNKASRGYKKGVPIRYLVGHGSRLSPVEYLVKDLGYKTPCWVWQRSLRQNGYAQTRRDDGKPTYAHIVYYEKAFSKVPDGMMLDHLCKVRRCVNPNHLQPCTNAQNTQRGMRATLDPHTVSELRRLHLAGLSYNGIARLTGISYSTVFYAASERTWRNV